MVRVELWTGGRSNRASYRNTRGREPRVVRVRPSRAISDNCGSIVDLMPGYSYTLWGLWPLFPGNVVYGNEALFIRVRGREILRSSPKSCDKCPLRL